MGMLVLAFWLGVSVVGAAFQTGSGPPPVGAMRSPDTMKPGKERPQSPVPSDP